MLAFIYYTPTRAPVTDDQSMTRRSALRAVGAAAVAGLTTTAATASTAQPAQSADGQSSTKSTAARQSRTDSIRTTTSGRYTGTIDRIVDGEHAVILLESGGQTVGQEVIDRDRIPRGSEGDSVEVWLLWGRIISIRVL